MSTEKFDPEKINQDLGPNEVLTREESESGAISPRTIEAAEKWIDQQPIKVLIDLILKDKWVIEHDEEEIESATEKEIREMMKDELYEDTDYVEDALKNTDVPVRYDKD